MVLQDIAELHFNSQPHKEADQIAPYARRQYYISTHSLTRRLTEFQEKYENAFANFNSQPHKEADCKRYPDNWALKAFQLTASQGG